MRLSLKSTSTRTFGLWPAVVLAEQFVAWRKTRPSFLLLLAWGYLQYRWAGDYRTKHGGGGPGISNPPVRLVSSGIYGWTRNPMYLGHLIFYAGLYLTARSPLSLALLAWHIPWFDARVDEDERRLRELFGHEYDAYAARVPRWLPYSHKVAALAQVQEARRRVMQ